MSKSLWERMVDWSVALGERILAPIERFIGKRSLVGDATFFPLERFPWVEQIEANGGEEEEELPLDDEEEKLDEEADEDDEGGPDDPVRHLHRQAARIRRGEMLDRLTVLLRREE